MNNTNRLIVSHAPFVHVGSSVVERHWNIFAAALPAALFGCFLFGMPAAGVVALSVALCIFWEWLINRITRRETTIGDGHAALMGLLCGMVLPATAPWWLVLVGSFLVMIIGKHIFGGIGSNPFHPVALAMAIMMLSWPNYLDFNEALVHYNFDFSAMYPLTRYKFFGADAVADFSAIDFLMGRQIGGIGSVFGLGLIAGGLYLILRGFIRWEIAGSFLAGIFICATLFYGANPGKYASPIFHLLTGYTLIGAVFLATEDSSSPVNFIPMLIYGAMGGVLTVLIRTIGAWVDGVMLSILLINTLGPLLDKIRPGAIGKVT